MIRQVARSSLIRNSGTADQSKAAVEIEASPPFRPVAICEANIPLLISLSKRTEEFLLLLLTRQAVYLPGSLFQLYVTSDMSSTENTVPRIGSRAWMS